MLVSLAYQTHGEGWRLGAGADVDLHIQRQASGGCVLGVCVCVCELGKKEMVCMSVKVVKGGPEWKKCCQPCHIANDSHSTPTKINYTP